MRHRALERLPDAELLRRTAGGDDAAFSAFYRRHLDGVLAFLRRRVATPDVAYDLTAEVFAAVVVGAGQFRADGEPAGWLYGIARNKLRESLRRGRVESDARERLGLEPVVLDDPAIERVEERASAGGERLERALGALSGPVRDALLARVVDDEDYAAIAARLDCSEQVIRQRVSRGLRALKVTLEEER